MSQHLVRCSNCGTTWFLESALVVGGDATRSQTVCPVCHLAATQDDTELVRIESVADLEGHLDLLVRSAWASGLSTDAVVHALREELAFAAELGHAGRRFTVQLIDLGPQEGELQQRPLRDRRDLATKRGKA